MPRLPRRSSGLVLVAVVALGAAWLGSARSAAQQQPPSQPGVSAAESRPAPSGDAARGAQVVAKVGDRVITVREIEERLQMFPENIRERLLKGNNLRTYVKNLVVKELAAREAVRRGIDQEPRVRERLEETRQDVLYNALTTKLLETIRVTEADMEAYFEAHKSEFAGKEYKDVKPQVAERLRNMKSRAVYDEFQREAERHWPVTVNEAALKSVSVPKGSTNVEEAIKEAERVVGPLTDEQKKMMREGTAPVAPVQRSKPKPSP
jgi:hypothetical protein